MKEDNELKNIVKFCEELPSYKYVRNSLDRLPERRFYFCRVTSPETDLWWDAPGIGFFVPKFEILEKLPRERRINEHDLLSDITQERYGLFIEFRRYFYRNVGKGISSEYIKERITGIYAATPREVAKLIDKKHKFNPNVRALRKGIKYHLKSRLSDIVSGNLTPDNKSMPKYHLI